MALALRNANFVSRNIGLAIINEPFAVVPAFESIQFCFKHKKVTCVFVLHSPFARFSLAPYFVVYRLNYSF